VKPGEPLEIEPPADLRITNVALSDELEDQQARSSLRLIYRSPEAGSDDEDEEDEEEDEEGAAEKVIDTILCSLTPGRVSCLCSRFLSRLTRLFCPIDRAGHP
jgi:FK506-binding nuclear protein